MRLDFYLKGYFSVCMPHLDKERAAPFRGRKSILQKTDTCRLSTIVAWRKGQVRLNSKNSYLVHKSFVFYFLYIYAQASHSIITFIQTPSSNSRSILKLTVYKDYTANNCVKFITSSYELGHRLSFYRQTPIDEIFNSCLHCFG